MADSESGGENSRTAQIIGGIALLALVAGTVFAVIGIYPHKIPEAKNPSFVDDIFASRVVLLFVRIALMFAAGYVVISVVGLIIGRRWIAELGPFKASEPIAKLDASATEMEGALSDALETIEDLEQRLLESDQTLAQANGHIGDLLDHIDTMESKKAGD